MNTSTDALSYRPRNAGHDYYGRGCYLITLVVSGRERLLSSFVADLGRKPALGPKSTLALTPLGEAVAADPRPCTHSWQQGGGTCVRMHA